MKKTQKIIALITATVIMLGTFAFAAIGAEPVKGSEVAAFASELEGCGYQYASKGPNKFDCSGFVYYVLTSFGLKAGNSTADYNTREKAAKFGTVIDNIEDALPGDIIVWGSHVAVYLGDGMNISALNSNTGVCVREVSDFRDKHGVKNPSHFFVRPYDYVEETEEESVVAETEVQTKEKATLKDRIIARREARREYIRNMWEPVISKF